MQGFFKGRYQRKSINHQDTTRKRNRPYILKAKSRTGDETQKCHDGFCL